MTTQQTYGRGGWPLVPSLRFKGETTLACPACGSTNVMLTCFYGPGGRLGDPGSREVNRCDDCRKLHVWDARDAQDGAS